MIIPIANPLVSEEESQIILDHFIATQPLASGVKACLKYIKNTEDKNIVLIISGDIFPMDLVSHLPVFCEDNSVDYIFVPSKKWIQGCTCAIISKQNISESMSFVLEKNTVKMIKYC